jgi:hypothetical protein
VLALAGDAASGRAARGLATPRPWSGAGADDHGVWGECSGSSATPYRTAVDLTGPAYQCSCPSRKVPCKHALGLLMLWAQGRSRRARRRSGPTSGSTSGRRGRPRGPSRSPRRRPTPRHRPRRLASRTSKTTEGLTELDRWLRDLMRQGLAAAQAQPFAFWDTVAARMVDAQAPGAGGKLRRMSGAVRGDSEWPGRLLDQAARLHLLVAAWQRRDELDPDLRDEVRSQLGWPWSVDDVLSGPTHRDVWYVVGQHLREDERLRTRRTWLWGFSSDRPAVITETAPVIYDLPPGLAVGTRDRRRRRFLPGRGRDARAASHPAQRAAAGPVDARPRPARRRSRGVRRRPRPQPVARALADGADRSDAGTPRQPLAAPRRDGRCGAGDCGRRSAVAACRAVRRAPDGRVRRVGRRPAAADERFAGGRLVAL